MNGIRIKRTIIYIAAFFMIFPIRYGDLMKKADDAVAWKNDAVQAGTCNAMPAALLNADSQNSALSFPDKILEKCIREQINKPQGEIRLNDVTAIRSLKIANKKIGTLAGLQYLSGLETLELRMAGVTDIKPLETLTGLKALDLSYNEITDIKPLAKLIGLRSLDLASNAIADIEPLRGLTNLKMLSLYNNRIGDIRPLSDLTSLTDLDLFLNGIADVKPLEGLCNLEKLSLGFNNISDLTPLGKLSGLKVLEAGENKIAGLDGLNAAGSLEALYLHDNRITNLDGIRNLLKLRYLDLVNNRIQSLAPLGRLSLLTSLSLDRNQIQDLSGLENLKQLKTLRLENNMIDDISPLAGLSELNSLTLRNNLISDVASLSGLKNLTNLDISYNNVGDISVLRSNPKLSAASVGIEGNPLPGYVYEDALKDRFILANMSPYIQNAMTEYFGVSKAYMNERILSIEKTGGGYKLRIYLETFTGAHNPPYGKDVVTLALDYAGISTAGYEHEEDPPWSNYENREYRVLLKYPPEWRKDTRETLSDRYAGMDGFFMIGAISGGDYLKPLPIDDVVRSSAYHKLTPYGSDPVITALKVDNQDARLISPSSDQPDAPPYQSELIVKYPGPVEINGNIYHYFILYADGDHIKDIAKTIRFAYLTE